MVFKTTSLPVLLLILWQLLVRELLECSRPLVLLRLHYLIYQRLLTESDILCSYKSRLYGVMKRCFILLRHFKMVIEFELFWRIDNFLIVPLMLYYLRIFFPIFFALNDQRKLNKIEWETESFIYRLKSIKATFCCFKLLSMCIFSLYIKLELIAMNELGKVWFHSTFLKKIDGHSVKNFRSLNFF